MEEDKQLEQRNVEDVRFGGFAAGFGGIVFKNSRDFGGIWRDIVWRDFRGTLYDWEYIEIVFPICKISRISQD